MTIYRILSTSEPEKSCYYMAFGQQLPIPEFARMFSEAPWMDMPADDAQNPSRSIVSAIDSFRRALRAKGCYVEFQENEVQSLVTKVGARVEEITLNVWKPKRGGLQDGLPLHG